MLPSTRPLDYIAVAELPAARARLSEFVRTFAEFTRGSVGFGWTPCPTAPSTYEALQTAFARSSATGEPLPVSSEHTEPVIYTSAGVNLAHRFVHDVHHVRLGLSFELADELELALWHLDRLRAAGFGRHSLEYALFHADLIGQVLVNGLGHRFPADQERFALDCVRLGIDAGVLLELRRLE
ncbi:hypothetical protein [Rhodococcus aetherivorans]|uniref:hypothetical protein n=1 Tax=Rhodococcus aetherivorans TaxID=191292 RepID=UPI000622D08B|nr:hypothetical protein [Rhodococcus aetherivorans]AKE89618.1 hypothetical protein AAT18_10695 [Rhodococcus aetherivorans]